jgi:hypothetical protein
MATRSIGEGTEIELHVEYGKARNQSYDYHHYNADAVTASYAVLSENFYMKKIEIEVVFLNK